MQIEVGNIVEGKVTKVTKFGAFVDIGDGRFGMIHISQISNSFVKEVSDHLVENQTVKVKVLSIDGTKIDLSIKQAEQNTQRPTGRVNKEKEYENRPQKRNEPASFEDLMSKFKKSSDEKMCDIKKNIDNKRGSYSKRGSK